MKLSWNVVFILSYFFTRAFGAISPEIRLTSAIASSAASSTCVSETFTITSPYGITGSDLNCSMDHGIDLLLDGDENTWWQSMTQDENITLNFQFNNSFILSGAQLVFRSPLPQLVLIQVRLNGSLVTTLVYADDCQAYSGTCYPLGSIVDYEMNCSDISSCPQLVNLNHTLPNVTANSITYMLMNMDTELLNTSEAQYYAVAEVTIYGYVPTNYYCSSLHSIVSEAEDGIIAGRNDPLPLLTTIPQFSGNGYTNIATDNQLLPFRWFIEIPRSSAYQMILRYGNTNDSIEAPLFTGLVMSLNRNGNSNSYRFFIESCNMAWCYSQAVGVTDTTTVANYPLEAGLWEINALMNVQNLLLDVFIAIPEEFYNPVSLGSAADRFTDECGLSTNTLGRGTTNEYFCFQNAFILSYSFHPMLFECFCDAIGSVEQLCDPIGGQCPCKQSVNGSTQPYSLNCNLCPSLSYGPTNTGCEECNCINNTQCNVSTGECPCPPLVVGRQCSQCEPNTFGDPATAYGCTRCMCDEPGTALCNSTSGECVCEPFYAGATCDQCMIDAFNDTVAGCQPCQCSVTGSINQSCSSTGQCNCKPLVSEPKCTSCELGAFYFTDSGCIECWCNGLTGIECDTFNGSYETVAVRFDTGNSIEGWSLAVLNGDEFIFTTAEIYLEMSGDIGEATLSANISNINSSMPVYWNVPSNYVNMNWLFAYGGDLVVETIQGDGIINFANGVGSGTGSTYSVYGVYLMDDSTVLVHSIDPTMDINIITVSLVEDSWLDASTGRPVTRPVFMSVLANLSAILLPAVPADVSTTIIRLISFQYSNASTLGNNEIPIERCSCPVGHTGLSCQECVDGYFMSPSGLCISCQCNGYSTNCDPITGECQNCQDNTMGFNCEQCLPCYIDITSGPSVICEACNCSLTGCRNCSIDAFGEEQCACLTGYDGEQCSVCDNGYFQSPLSGECILSCGECVDKLVMMHNESMQDVAILQSRLGTLYYDLSYIYQQLNNVTLRVIPLMNMTMVSLDISQQLEDDLNMVDDCSIEVDNVTLQVNALWEQAMELHNQINSIPNLTNNAAEAMSLYRAVSTFNMTVFVVLSQLESFSMQANTILVYLTETVAANIDSYVNEINGSLQLLQNSNGVQARAANIKRIASAHQEKLDNISAQLQPLSTKVSRLDAQVNQLDMRVVELQQLAFDIQQLRLITMSLFSNVSNNYTRATNALQSARQEFTTAVNLEQDITSQLETLSDRLADQDGGSGSGSDGNQGGEVVQELSGLQNAVQNSFAFLSVINNSQAAVDARIHTNQLTINATTISRILVPALSLQPAEIVRNFSGLLASIEEAANNSVQANETITETLQQVMLLMSEGLANHATQLYTFSQDLSLRVVTLKTSLGTTQAMVDRASEDANIFEELRNDTENSVELALNQVSQLQIASNIVQYQVNSTLDSTISSLQCVTISLNPQQCEVDEELYSRLTAIEDTILNSTSLLNEANNSLTDALAIINDQTGIIPVIQNQSITNNQQIEQLNVSVQALRQRVVTARRAIASIAVALRLSGNQTYSYSLPTSAYEDGNEHTQLSMIFRTVGPDGTLLYSSNSMDQCVSLGVINRRVVFSFVLDTMSVVVNNPLSIQDDIWYQIFATRDADVGRLSVTQLQGATVTTYATGVGSANASAIPLMDEVYVGGISSMMTGNCVSSEQFTGCVDTVVVNNEPLPLLLPNQGLDSVTPCGPRPPVEPTRLFDSSTWLLGGGSYVILTADQQSTSIFRVMMGFRTSNPYGIFYFSGKSVVIFLMDGQVWYRISGVFSECEVNTAQRYDDDTWHYLTALFSGGECSITVDDEVVTQSTSDLIIAAQLDNNYIGGAPLFAGRGLPFVSFAGCLRDVIIGTVRRNLSDNIGNERVNFNGCPVNVTSGVRFNGEGYARLWIASELVNDSLTNIMFSFKTTQVTGLLLQLGRENKLILSLYHSHVRLEYYYNISSVVLESSSAGYNDNLWHMVSVTLANDMITLMIDSVITATQERLPSITLPDQLTIGGSSASNFLSNIDIRYRGCFRDLVINSQSHDFHNPVALVGVSLFGCYLPADLPPIPTSTVVTMATTSTVPGLSSDIAVMTSIQTMSVSIPLSTTADVVTTEQPISTFSPETLSTPELPSTSFSITVTTTPVIISTVILPTPTSVINDCDPNPCENGGSCTDAIDGYSCTCVAGYTGDDCTVNIDDCDPNPCENGGNCTDAIDGYSCICEAGYTGDDCTVNIDDCDPNPCENGGNCTDAIDGYSCTCEAGYTGDDCSENIDDCDSNPCENGGNCTDAIDGYSCTCEAGYTGDDCSENIDDCDPNPCENGGNCTDAIDGYFCTCEAGYTGDDCTVNIDDCDPNPCENGGNCTDGIDGYSCTCEAGYTGDDCTINIDDCDPNPCENGGNCTDAIDGYSCTCEAGYTGDDCTINIDDCDPNPCENGGNCTDAIDGYSCICEAGYTGDDCTVNIDDCDPNPCENGGNCTDAIDGYSCICEAGYTGDDCSENIDDCDPNPCENGGNCTDAIDGYSCTCEAGYTGDDCTENIDDCDPNPCENGGNCTDAIDGYSCTCEAGYTGDDCTVNIDDCDPNPCENGGNCTDAIDGYSCTCEAGYTGDDCTVNIDDCDPNPCENGGNCTDAIDGYSCTCVAGYTGEDCVINIDDCDPNPCENGGNCTDGIDGYFCTGYTTLTPVVSETPTSIVSETPTSIVSEAPTSIVLETTQTSVTVVSDSTFTPPSISSMIQVDSQSTEISITPTVTLTSAETLISISTSIVSIPNTTAFTSTSAVSIVTTSATIIPSVIPESTTPVETLATTTRASITSLSSEIITTTTISTSVTPSMTVDTISNPLASSAVPITTTSVELSTPSATTMATITPTTLLSSETQIITSVTPTEISTSVLTSSTLPTPTPLPLTLGLNGLGSFISLAPRSDLISSYNIQMMFQTRSIDGILLYTESAQNGDYLALYIRNGLITYSFDLGGGAITVESSEQYSDGLLHNVTIDRTDHISLVIIDNGAEVIRAVGRSSFTQLNLGMDNFYVGGVSPMVAPSKIREPGEQSFPSVEACISSLNINNEEVNLNLNNNNSGIVDCSDVLINEVVTFTGNSSYAKLLESFSPITDFQLTLSFRSSIENKVDCKGLLVYIGSSNFFDHLTLNLDGGRLLLTFNNGRGTTAVEYNRADVNFCDGNWYEVEVMKSGLNGHLILNGTDSEMSSSAFSMFTSIDSTEPLFIGGIPSTVATAHNVTFTPFSGCIRNLMLYRNGQIVPAFISRSAELVNVNLEDCSL